MDRPHLCAGYQGEGGPFTAPQLKVIQEFISLSAFAIFTT